MMLYVSNGCQSRLPAVLIEYLWKLAAEDLYFHSDGERQVFLLSAKYTGAGEIQDILIRRAGASSWRTVFGYQPVDAAVEVYTEGNDAYMALQDESAVCGIHYKTSGKEAATCSD